MQAQANRTAEAKAAHAALVERDERAGDRSPAARRGGARARDQRVATRREDLRRDRRRAATELQEGDRRVRGAGSTSGCARSTSCASACATADERRRRSASGFDEQDGRIREARKAARSRPRRGAAHLDVARATAESDLSHLASSCVETVQATLDEVAAEVAQLERDGLLASPKPVDDAPDAAEIEDERRGAAAAVTSSAAAEPESAPPGRT